MCSLNVALLERMNAHYPFPKLWIQPFVGNFFGKAQTRIALTNHIACTKSTASYDENSLHSDSERAADDPRTPGVKRYKN